MTISTAPEPLLKRWRDRLSSGGFGPLAQLSVGLMFLTRLRLPVGGSWPEDALARAAWSFPIAGALVGGVGGGVALLALRLGLVGPLAALLAVTATILLTGALHEDGLADTVDGFGGGRTVERKLEIMKDSRIGTYGVLALLLSLGLRVECVTILMPEGALALLGGLAASHAMARAFLPGVMRVLLPARPGGLGAKAGVPSAPLVWLALSIGLAASLVGLGFWRGLVAALVAVVVMASVAALARRQIGGYTGDVLGAIEQAGEIAMLLVAVAR